MKNTLALIGIVMTINSASAAELVHIFSSPSFSGIDFNPDFFSSSTSLTLQEADALYLNKTVADTANVLETFTVGISANIVQASTATISTLLSVDASSEMTHRQSWNVCCNTESKHCLIYFSELYVGTNTKISEILHLHISFTSASRVNTA